MTARRSEVPVSARTAAVAALPDQIAFLGLGLIGGSIALALREAGSKARLVAWTPAGAGPAEGLRRGLIDKVASSAAAAIDGAGLVILAGPPRSIVAALHELADELHAAVANGATITDVASTKGLIVATAEDLRLPFVGGHPMAGRETTGLAAGTADLFVDRPWVVVPAEGAEAACRPGRGACEGDRRAPVVMTAIDHDLAVAAISHLPLIAAAALVESVASEPARWAAARPLAAGGWRDMTRLARGDPSWAPTSSPPTRGRSRASSAPTATPSTPGSRSSRR